MYLLKTNEWQFLNPTHLWRCVPPFNQNLVVSQLPLVSFRDKNISWKLPENLTSQVTVDSIDTLCAGEASKPRVPVAVLSVQQRVAWASNTPQKIIISAQIKIFHQPRFPWNKGIPLTEPPFGVRSCEVAIIWPDYVYIYIYKYSIYIYKYSIYKFKWDSWVVMILEEGTHPQSSP